MSESAVNSNALQFSNWQFAADCEEFPLLEAATYYLPTTKWWQNNKQKYLLCVL
jgi:hypothetical protein